MKTIGTIESLKRGYRSAYGNPSWVVTLTDGRVFQTSPNVMVSYALDNPEFKGVPVEFTLSRFNKITSAIPVS